MKERVLNALASAAWVWSAAKGVGRFTRAGWRLAGTGLIVNEIAKRTGLSVDLAGHAIDLGLDYLPWLCGGLACVVTYNAAVSRAKA